MEDELCPQEPNKAGLKPDSNKKTASSEGSKAAFDKTSFLGPDKQRCAD
mgnify:CR=1 FL=1